MSHGGLKKIITQVGLIVESQSSFEFKILELACDLKAGTTQRKAIELWSADVSEQFTKSALLCVQQLFDFFINTDFTDIVERFYKNSMCKKKKGTNNYLIFKFLHAKRILWWPALACTI